ncbi:uncharacterized protein Bfra_008474 [Botrytis fragariae]|uniref:Uncharacterized protein n=1 Tax=Botrytis fragariae TaxID=1964551 RepID=A0A8H6EIK0_9HELO|nr:uncharacterized protein Bfra_008474 [Botrytis fragariae]KAF5873195.1 hypothetical protein Bfra_008474 [Botrytis fragariae]
MSDIDKLDSSIRRKILPIEREFGNNLIYDGYGMKSNSHTFDSNLEIRLPSADGGGTRPEGLKRTGTIYEMIDRLRKDGHKPMVPKLIALETAMRDDYQTQYIATREELEEEKRKAKFEHENKWNNELDDPGKARQNPEKFLGEKFPAYLDSKREKCPAANVRKAALSLGLIYESSEVSKFDEPPLQRDLSSLIHIAIGRTGPAVTNEIEEIHQIRGKAMQKAREAMKNARDIISEAHDDVIRASDDKAWDVTGDWHVSCLEMERRWPTPLTLKIYSQESDGQCQLSGEFDFGGVSGLFRFEQQFPTIEINSARLAHPNVKRGNITFTKAEKEKKGVNEDEDDDSDNNIEYRRTTTKRLWCKSTAEAFSFPSTEKPSLHNPTQRGVPGQYLCSITFGEPLGTTLTGTFGGDLYRTWKEDMAFTGVKVGVGGTPIDIEKEWRDGQNII